jgi:hypothetical protein
VADVLQLSYAAVSELGFIPVADIFLDGLRDADAAGIGDLLQARRDIDAIAKDVVAINDHVTNIDADTKVESLIRGKSLVALGHAPLHVNRTTHRIDRAWEFQQRPSPVVLTMRPLC